MTDPKVSERMFNLVTDFGADCINYGCNQLRPMVGYPLVENVQHREKEAALLSAIAEIEQRAERWKEAAVALYQCSRELADIGCKDFALTNNRLEAAITALGDEWDEAVKEEASDGR